MLNSQTANSFSVTYSDVEDIDILIIILKLFR